jgi:SAM-dependent methyltransferase
MRHNAFAETADRWLSRVFPSRFGPGPAARRHAQAGSPQLWRMQRAFQIHFLQRMGLTPDQTLLDLGCGTLRGGLPLIGFLAARHYTGIDVRADVIDEARRELEEAGLQQRHPTLAHVESLDGLYLGHRFDVVWAFSVCMHLEDPELERALDFVARHLAARGRAFANVHLGDGTLGRWAGFPIVARPLDWYGERAAAVGLRTESLGRLRELGHLSGDRSSDSQFMLCFRSQA